MYCKPIVDFFLGALSPSGFSGWFAQAAADPDVTAYLIKSGPGCGKSTFMRRLAEADADHPTPRGTARIERIHCSSDPDSLDGVLLGDVGALFLDATAPHTLDCKYPGAAERVVSLYEALDNDYLDAHQAEILSAGAKNSALLQQAAASFALACGILQQRRALATETLDSVRLARFGRYLGERLLPPRRGVRPGRQQHRLLSAPTPEGLTFYPDTITALADNVYVLQDPCGAASAALLAQLAEHACANGYDAILCHCASDQTRLDHLLLPGLRLAFATSNPWHSVEVPGQRNLHLRRFMNTAALQQERRALSAQKRAADMLLNRTCTLQARAKAVHDVLEEYYIHAADFAAVDAIRRRLEQQLFC